MKKFENNLEVSSANTDVSPLTKTEAEEVRKMFNVFKSVGMFDFQAYLQSSRKIIWSNFLAGIFRGLGIVIGMTFVLTFVIWMLSELVDFPVLGEYAKAIKELIETSPLTIPKTP